MPYPKPLPLPFAQNQVAPVVGRLAREAGVTRPDVRRHLIVRTYGGAAGELLRLNSRYPNVGELGMFRHYQGVGLLVPTGNPWLVTVPVMSYDCPPHLWYSDEGRTLVPVDLRLFHDEAVLTLWLGLLRDRQPLLQAWQAAHLLAVA